MENERTTKLATLLQQEHLQVYTTLATGNDDSSSLRANKQFKFLGYRQTSPIYFYQALVRYAHIYGRIPLGDAHEMSEFIQDYGPGVMLLARDELSSEEEKIFLGGLYLGIPAIVPSSFFYPMVPCFGLMSHGR